MSRFAGLTQKQYNFVKEYLVDSNPALAAVRAGYKTIFPAVQAGKLMEDPRIKKALEHAVQAQATRSLITGEKIIEDIERIAKKAEEEGRYNDALKGKELLGKHFKLFTDKLDVNGSLNVPLTEIQIQINELLKKRDGNGSKRSGDPETAQTSS